MNRARREIIGRLARIFILISHLALGWLLEVFYERVQEGVHSSIIHHSSIEGKGTSSCFWIFEKCVSRNK